MSDRLAVMDNGIVSQVGPPRDVYTEPANAYVADFLGVANLLDGRGDRAPRPRAVTACGSRASSCGAATRHRERAPVAAKIVIRPERARIVEYGAHGREPHAGHDRPARLPRPDHAGRRAAAARRHRAGARRQHRRPGRARAGHAGDARAAGRRAARAARRRPPRRRQRRSRRPRRLRGGRARVEASDADERDAPSRCGSGSSGAG